MYCDCIKGAFILNAPHVGCFANLNLDLLLLLRKVKDKIDIEQYDKTIKDNCCNYRASLFDESKS